MKAKTVLMAIIAVGVLISSIANADETSKEPVSIKNVNLVGEEVYGAKEENAIDTSANHRWERRERRGWERRERGGWERRREWWKRN